MVAFNKKTEGGKQVATHLSPRGNRTNSGQVHSIWVGVSAPQNAATSLSAIPVDTSVAISFTAPTDNGGMTITNYQYAISSNGGSSYGSYTALSPADGVSPITVSGLTQNTAYLIKLKAVNDVGVSDVESAPVSFTTAGVPTGTTTISSVSVGSTTATVNFSTTAGGGAITGYDLYVANFTNAWNNTTGSPISVTGLSPNTTYTFYVRAKNAYGVGPQSAGVNATTAKVAPSSVEYLVIAGGAGGGGAASSYWSGGGGGAGGYRTSVVGATSGRGTSAESAAIVSGGTGYTVTVGAGGAGGGGGGMGSNGNPSVFSSITSTGGGGGGWGEATGATNGNSGGCGGGAARARSGGAGTPAQGYDAPNYVGGQGGTGGGGAGGAGQTGQQGGAGLSNSITGSAVSRGGGGGGGNQGAGDSSASSGGGAGYNAFHSQGTATSGTANTGGGGGGSSAYGSAGAGGAGGSGIVIFRYPDTFADVVSIGAGLTKTGGGTTPTTTTGGYKIYQFTAGTGTVTF